jgi:hypothetical protein
MFPSLVLGRTGLVLGPLAANPGKGNWPVGALALAGLGTWKLGSGCGVGVDMGAEGVLPGALRLISRVGLVKRRQKHVGKENSGLERKKQEIQVKGLSENNC